MIPSEPYRQTQVGHLFLPPYRVQGVSIAGEESFVQIPELGVCFDIGRAPKIILPCQYVALTHGHMDHAAGIAYYFSQRNFQGMQDGTLVCPKTLEQPVHNLMRAWQDIEAQRTPYRVVGLEHEGEIEIKNTIYLRGFRTDHTVPSLGYAVVEKRSKLLPELAGQTQEQILVHKKAGRPITRVVEVPIVAYIGDSSLGPFFDRPDVRDAKILITECTFLEDDHHSRSRVGKHLHVMDIVEILKTNRSEAVVLTHLSRRTIMSQVRTQIDKYLPASERDRVFLLMDHRANRRRFERQLNDAEETEYQRQNRLAETEAGED